METNSKSKCYSIQQHKHLFLQSSNVHTKVTSLMVAQIWAESSWEITDYGRFINLFLPNIIRSIWQFERINKKICRQKMSIMFNQIYIYIYIYARMYVLHLPLPPKKKKPIACQVIFIRWWLWGQAWYQSIMTTTNQECIFQNHLILLVFFYIIGLSDKDATCLYNPFFCIDNILVTNC